MEFGHLCMGCMADKGQATTCPYCHWNGDPSGTSPLDLPLQIVLGKRFVIGRPVHRTSLHTTYIAFDQKTGKRLVIKEYQPRCFNIVRDNSYHMKPSKSDDVRNFEDGLAHFIREGSALQKLPAQAGMAKVYGMATANGTAYQAIEHIDGVNFEKFVQRDGGQISFNLTIKILLPVMAALETAHEAGICHYDIHPGNIVVTRDFLGCLVNFNAAGFAVIRNNKTLRDQLVPAYAAPELFTDDGAPGPWSDIYSVAALMYRALTGAEPPGSLKRLRKDTLKPPSHLGKNLWMDAEKSLLRALSLSASTRLRSMGAFQKSLIESVPPKEKNRTSQAIDAFASVNCPYCGIMNEILVTDLESGASNCFACDHSLQIQTDLTPAIAPAGDRPFQFSIEFDQLVESVEADVLQGMDDPRQEVDAPDPVTADLPAAAVDQDIASLLDEIDSSLADTDSSPSPDSTITTSVDDDIEPETPLPPTLIMQPGENLPATIEAQPPAVLDTAGTDAPAEMLTRILCPACGVENELPPMDILSGATCKGCHSPFISAELRQNIDTRPAPAAGTTPQIPARSRMPFYIGAAAIVLLASAWAGFSYFSISPAASGVEAQGPDFLFEADLLFEQENFESALSMYQNALIVSPEDDYIHERIQACLDALNPVTEDEPLLSEFERMLQQGDSLLEVRLFEEAQPLYEAALLLKPGDEYALDQLALVKKQLARAAPVIKKTQPKVSLVSGSDLYETIQQLGSRSSVQLASGIYFLSQPLQINRTINIAGAGSKKTVVSFQGSGNAISVGKGGKLTIDGVGFEYRGDGGANLLMVSDGSVTISNSGFTSAKAGGNFADGGAGIYFGNGAGGTVRATDITGNRSGIRIEGRANPLLERNDVFRNGNGILIGSNARPRLSKNQVHDNEANGIWLTGSPQPTVLSNTIRGNGGSGVFFNTTKYSGEFRGNTIISNSTYGLLISGESQPVIEGNTIKSNAEGGIKYKDGASGVSRNNQIVDNHFWGIHIENLARPSLEANTIKGNRGDGIEIVDKAKPTITKNEILKNSGDGINLVLSQAGGFIRNNICSGNQGYGISILSDPQPEMSSNALAGNSEGELYNEYESRISP